jgi:hypothetical protein
MYLARLECEKGTVDSNTKLLDSSVVVTASAVLQLPATKGGRSTIHSSQPLFDYDSTSAISS